MKRRDRNVVRVGNVRIRWYKLGDGRTCLDLRKWRKENARPSFMDHSEALAEAERIAIELNAGGSDSQALSQQDRATYALVCAEVEALGVSLNQAVSEWAQARRAMAGLGRPLHEVVAAGVTALQRTMHPIQDVVLEFLASKAASDLHGRWLRGLRATGQALAEAFPKKAIEQIRAKDLEEFLDGRIDEETGERLGGLEGRGKRVGARRRNNVLKEIRQIFTFAQARGYLPDRITEAKKVGTIKGGRLAIGVVTPEAMQIYLEHVRAEFLPWLVLNAFSGLRSDEIVLSKDAARTKSPVKWEDFDWEGRVISVREATSKTGIPRPVPILDNVYQWLQPWRDAKARGPVCPPSMAAPRRGTKLEATVRGQPVRVDHERERFIKAAREAIVLDADRSHICLDYPHNGFRHSYGSYRMSILKNMQELSYEMGNSVAMIKRHYNNPRPIGQAHAWFSILPKEAANVVQFSLGL